VLLGTSSLFVLFCDNVNHPQQTSTTGYIHYYYYYCYYYYYYYYQPLPTARGTSDTHYNMTKSPLSPYPLHAPPVGHHYYHHHHHHHHCPSSCCLIKVITNLYSKED